MDKPSYIRNFGMKAWVILVELLLLVSCDNAIYDDEGDCSVTYHLKFRAYRSKWVLKSVQLFVIQYPKCTQKLSALI